MGNAPSSSAGSRPAVSDGGEGDVGPGGGGGGGTFRLPLYRGERDAFVPIDDHEVEEGGAERQRRTSGPPVLSVAPPRTSGADDLIVSPLHAHGAVTPRPFFGPVGGAADRPTGHSPPSVVSSSDSSGHWSCYSSSSAAPSNGEGASMPRSSQRRRGSDNLLPVPLPRPVPQRNGPEPGENGAFDCVRRPPAPRPPDQSWQKKFSSSGSLPSLFETCLRSDDDENEYEEDASEPGSCPSRGFRRSGSVASQHSHSSARSNFSNHSHNSYRPTSHAGSRASLASAFSSAAQLSHYTEEERAMADGDAPTFDSDWRRVRNYHVVTTAALPWMTGTAVNPLLRAAHLLRRNGELRVRNGGRMGEPREEGAVDGEASSVGGEASPGSAAAGGSRPGGARPSAKANRRGGRATRAPVEGETDAAGNDRASPHEAPPPATPRDDDDDDDCSLDYSCFSFSEIDAPRPVAQRELVSPLGEEDDDDDDSLRLSPFTPCDGGADAARGASEEGTEGTVTLVVPWLRDAADRQMLYGSNASFGDRGGQEAYIRSWLAEEAGMPEEASELDIFFYPAKYHTKYNSIFALGDICDLIPDEGADVCILEEPEHLNWYRAPGCASWSAKFRHCVGVVHTNYKAYAREHARAGFLAAPLLASVNSLVVQANCHRVVKLSGVLQEFASSECVENVHGIRGTYLEEGRRRRTAVEPGTERRRRAYFIGKLLWAKGFDQLLELQACFRERTGSYFAVDIFGSGPDESEIKRAFHGNEGEEGGILNGLWSSNGRRHRLPARFLGRVDHSKLAGDEYSIFINPSLTEVLCTTTAEAIAMGKWAVVPSHPSNAFFAQFPNCLQYRNRREFASKLTRALNDDPPHLTDELASVLSWEAATLRCVGAAAICKRDAAREKRMLRAKEEKTLTRKISGLFSKADINEETSPGSGESMGYGGGVPLISP